jgi:hypothetical protein
VATHALSISGDHSDVMAADRQAARARQLVERELRAVMAERDHDSVARLRGSMSHDAMPDPAGFERANYTRTLRSWASRAPVTPARPPPGPTGDGGRPVALHIGP